MMMMAANRFPSMPRASLSSSAEARTLRLLHGMQHLAIRNAPLPKVPVLRHSQRPPSYERGLSLPALKALRRFAGVVSIEWRAEWQLGAWMLLAAAVSDAAGRLLAAV